MMRAAALTPAGVESGIEPEPEPEVPPLAEPATTPGVHDQLTVVITTSPCRGGASVHQSLFRALFCSFGRLPELGAGPTSVIVVCDGYKLIKPGTSGKVRLKNGIVSDDIAKGYARFLDWFESERDKRATWILPYNVEIVKLPEWRGWSSALEHALRIVSTPFVMVVQDDRVFVPRWAEISQLLTGMAVMGPASIGYVLLPCGSKFRTHEASMRSLAGQHGIKLGPDELILPTRCSQKCSSTLELVKSGDVSANKGARVTAEKTYASGKGLRLLRCWRILDSTHIASVAWYRDLYRQWPELTRKGMFAEECLSSHHLQDSLAARPWPTWLLAARDVETVESEKSRMEPVQPIARMIAHTDRGKASEMYSRVDKF